MKNLLFAIIVLGLIQPVRLVAEIYLPIWGTLKAQSPQSNGDLYCNSVGLDSPDLSCTRTSSSSGYVYSITFQQDFDSDGVKDTLSFDLRVEGFVGSTFSYSEIPGESSMTVLGTPADVTDIDNRFGVGGDFDIDEGESLRFSVGNIYSSLGDSVTFQGLGSVSIMETNGGHSHKYIVGQGTGLDSFSFNSETSSYGITGGANEFLITGAGSNVANREWAISSISFQFRGPLTEWDPTDYSYYTIGPYMLDEYPAQQDFTNYPDFSWDIVPRWLIARKHIPWTQDEIEAMANNYPLIVWEKANPAGFDTVEQGIIDTSTRVKAINPSVKCIFYRNSGMHYTGYASDATYNAWEYGRKTTDDDGNEVLYLQNGRWMYDHDVAAMRHWWVYDAGLPTILNDVIDGVFYDKCGWGDYIFDEQGNPVSNYIDMLTTLGSHLPPGKLVMGNTLRNERGNGSRDLMRILQGSYLERWMLGQGGKGQTRADAICVSMQLMLEATHKGKIILFRTGENSAASTREEMEADMPFHLALYLMVAGPYSYYAYQDHVAAHTEDYHWETTWMPEFNRPLGEPLTQALKDGYVYSRSFEHLDVRVDVEAEETFFAWDSVDTDSDGLDDLWEFRNFGDLTKAVASADADGDGYANLEEYVAKADPNKANEYPLSSFITSFSDWLRLYPELENTEAYDDSDKDGMGLLAEYVLNGDPRNPDLDVMPILTMEGEDCILRYNRRSSSVNDTLQILEYSTDLVNWAVLEGDAINEVRVGNTVAGIEEVTIRIEPELVEEGRLYARLKVDHK